MYYTIQNVKYKVKFLKNLRETAFFIAEHAVCTVRASEHRRPIRQAQGRL
jgi:hypothetical protein